MTTPSVPRCGRMDPHPEHVWVGPTVRAHHCPGVVIHEGGARCQHCGHVVCTCDAELARERRKDWES